MARTKKIEKTEESAEQKPLRRYTRHTLEQRTLKSYITDGIVPYVAENLEVIEKIGASYLATKEMSKEDWTTIYDIVNHLCDITNGQDIVVFDKAGMSCKYTKSEHTSYYIAHTLDHMTYMMNQLSKSKTYDLTDKKGKDYYNLALYLVGQHLYFFITSKEKLGI